MASVLVRTFSAGVHFGELTSQEGKQVILINARRLWYWKGANTLHEVATAGVGKQSKISEPVPVITLTEAIEIMPISEAALKTLESRWS